MGGGEPAFGSSTGHQRVAMAFMVAWWGGLQRRGHLLRRASSDPLENIMVERAVEAMVTGATQVFRDDALQARSVVLNLTTTRKLHQPTRHRSHMGRTHRMSKRARRSPRPRKGRNRRNARATPAKKGASRGRTRKNSPASDSNGESDANTGSDSDGAMPTPSARKSKKHLGGFLLLG